MDEEMQAIDEWDTVYRLSSEDKGIFCERGTAYYLLFRKAGRAINAVIIESINDINIKKELRETALSPAPVVLFIYPYTPCDCQNRDKPYESKH